MKKINQSVVLAVTLACSFSIQAACQRSHVCDDYGQNCRYQDICTSTLDLPSIQLDPLPSLPTLAIKPLPSIELPPIGTRKCDYKQVNGRWQNVCH